MTLLENIVKNNFGKQIRECSDQELYKALLDLINQKTENMPTHDSKKKLYYISAEFLIGKLLSNNLLNLGIYDEVENELIANGKSIAQVEEAENEPSLGNGGLGRLAACFLDSIATLGVNGDGVGLNYHFGLFRQFFIDNQQETRPDAWLTQDSWLQLDESRSYEVPFKKFTLKSTLYNIDVLGYDHNKKNRLRLFDLDTVNSDIIKDGTIAFDKTNIKENLTLFLYPDDSDHAGNLLRIYQQYFMVSNGAQLIIDEAIERGSKITDLDEYAVIQINDTHPAFVIPELIRLLTTQHDIEFNEAVRITSNMVAFTNHTILSEALEKWPLSDLQEVMPGIAEIIIKLDKLKKEEYPGNKEVVIIDDNNVVHMASIAIHFGFSINGVAKLHTDILKNTELKTFYDIYPERFNNKTNGITFRRWIMKANPRLASLLDETIGKQWRKDSNLKPLANYIDDQRVLTKLRAIKFQNTLDLKEMIQLHQGITINEHSIIDVQIKRIHEYKRQQMLALYIVYKYMDIKNGNIPETPITILFGGKAAPAYIIAQDIIHMIITLAEIISNDPDVSPHLQVVMIENYNVSYAESLIPAADISEQISLASKEASGTGNMKFMLNGALQLCTMDGANVEIAEKVGMENVYSFGKSSEEIVKLYETNGYNPQEYYHRNSIKPLVDFILSPGMLYLGNEERLRRLHHDISNKDYFMTLIDLEEFIEIKEKMYKDYEDHESWSRKALYNISQAGFFSSDRTISDYNREIWHLEQEKPSVGE